MSIRSDKEHEFIYQVLLAWIATTGVTRVLNDPGKPWQNGMDESFHARCRDACLFLAWFGSRSEAAVRSDAWRVHYMHVCASTRLHYLTPSEFKLLIQHH